MVASTKITRVTINPVLLDSPPLRLEAMPNLRRRAPGAAPVLRSVPIGKERVPGLASPGYSRTDLAVRSVPFSVKPGGGLSTRFARRGASAARFGRTGWLVGPL